MGEKKRDGSGRFSRSVDDAGVLGAVRAYDPAATSEIAEEVGISRQGADRRLRSLREDGAVSSKKIGASLVWFIPRERAGGRDGFDAGDLQGDPKTTLDAESDESRRESDPVGSATEPPGEADDSDQSLDEALAALDTTDDRREAVRACVEYLRKHGSGQKSDFVDAVYPDHKGGYGSPGGWWNTIGKEYLKTVAEAYDPLTPPPKEGSHTWRFDP